MIRFASRLTHFTHSVMLISPFRPFFSNTYHIVFGPGKLPTFTMIIAPIVDPSTIPEIKSTASIDEMSINVPQTAECQEDEFNRIEVDSSDESSSAMELTPYPYFPTSEEIKDFHHLELFLGEDWSFRLACELSSGEMTVDGDDCGSACDSVSSYGDDSCELDSLLLLPEDIEICSHNHRGNFFDNVDIPVEVSSL
jgi:hypothetical protein